MHNLSIQLFGCQLKSITESGRGWFLTKPWDVRVLTSRRKEFSMEPERESRFYLVWEKEVRTQVLETRSGVSLGWAAAHSPPLVASLAGCLREWSVSTHPSGHRWTQEWVTHGVSQFSKFYVSPRVDCSWTLWCHILPLLSGWEGVLFVIWSIAEVV